MWLKRNDLECKTLTKDDTPMSGLVVIDCLIIRLVELKMMKLNNHQRQVTENNKNNLNNYPGLQAI